jgi:nicotinamidase-related amidase
MQVTTARGGEPAGIATPGHGETQTRLAPERHLLTTLDERVHPRHSAVLIVDMQNDYVAEGGASHRRNGSVAPQRAAIEPIRVLVQAARRAGALVIYIQMTLDADTRLSSDVAYLRRVLRFGAEPMVVKGTWGHEVVAELAAQPGDLRVEKQRSSSFEGTNLDLILRSSRIASVIVAGVVTTGCVLTTAQAAVMKDYYVTIPSDCVASPTPALHSAGLMLLTNYLVIQDSVVPSSVIIESWSRSGD